MDASAVAAKRTVLMNCMLFDLRIVVMKELYVLMFDQVGRSVMDRVLDNCT